MKIHLKGAAIRFMVSILAIVASQQVSNAADAQKQQNVIQETKINVLEQKNLSNFKILGISIETTNKNGQSIKDVEKIWGKFWGDNIPDKIPNKVSNDIYAVYTDYESDSNGKYTLIIGYPVTTIDSIPDGFVGRNISIGPSLKFISKGKMPDAILRTWVEIWNDTQLKRAYRADVTVHGQKYFDGDNAEVETYISTSN